MATRLQKRKLSERDENNELSNFIKNETTISKLQARGINHLFPIQVACYQSVYKEKDLIGKDRTGSGKTLSYALPLTEKFRKNKLFQLKQGQCPLILVVLPTRELAIQVNQEFTNLKHNDEYRNLALYGGTEIRQQIFELRNGIDLVVGTPGRIIDHLMRGTLLLKELKTIVLDEADEMLNMGFQEDVEKIYNYINEQQENKVQKLLFSATVPSWVKKIEKQFISEDRIFVDMFLKFENQTSLNVQHLAINCNYSERLNAIADIILCYAGEEGRRTILFAESKKECNEIMLNANINHECQVLHGDIPQKQREITFEAFRQGKLQCLIATNVAARGLDIPSVDLIVQLEPPKQVEDYIHRSGRTGRAGRNGICVTFYTQRQATLLDRIENKANIKLQRIGFFLIIIGAPQPHQIIEASTKSTIQKLQRVPVEILPYFNKFIEEQIDEKKLKETLSRCLAFMSGYKDQKLLQQRSLLFSQSGMVSYIMRPGFQIRFTGFVWNYLRQNFVKEISESIKFIKLEKTRECAAFDIPENLVTEFEFGIAALDNSNVIIEKADKMIEFEEEMKNQFVQKFDQQKNDFQNDKGKKLFQQKQFEVCVGNLPTFLDEPRIEELLQKNNIKYRRQIRLLREFDTGKSRGICFFECIDKDNYDRCLQLDRINYEGRKLRFNEANQKK